MSDSTLDSASGTAKRSTPMWLVATIAGVFGLFYAYALWNAVAFLITQATGPLGLNGYGWFILFLPIVFPIVVFAGAVAMGNKRPPHHLMLILLTGLALVAVFWLNVIAYSASYGAQMLG